MIVDIGTFSPVLTRLRSARKIGLDTETTGLRVYHGHQIFSLILAVPGEAYYFNFWGNYEKPVPTLPLRCLQDLAPLWEDQGITWFMHNARFDLAVLAREGVELKGKIHCTQSLARVVENHQFTYSLEDCAQRIGLEKSPEVENYIKTHKLWGWVNVPGRKTRKKDLFYYKVPFDVIVPYGEKDASVCLALGLHQEKVVEHLSSPAFIRRYKPLSQVADMEKDLTKVVFDMERRGIRVDLPYCARASAFETDRSEKARALFLRETGLEYEVSNTLFQEIFASEKEKWVKTEKDNPSFESAVLENFENPAAKLVLELRDAKSKLDFYTGFIYHADKNGIVHPSFNPAGAGTGRFSSSNPNFQNLTNEKEEVVESEFQVRRAILPHVGEVLISADYDQCEYRMMFDYACAMPEINQATPLVKAILGGKDPHQATADLVTSLGTPLLRKRAKNGNFALLYGSGNATLAKTIGGAVNDAKALRKSIFSVAPEIELFINAVMRAAQINGSVRTWLGRILRVDAGFEYKAPNYLIQGGCADVNKVALVRIGAEMPRSLVLNIHDQGVLSVPPEKAQEAGKALQRIMQGVYPHRYLPLTAGVEWSDRSLGDLKKMEVL